MPWQIMLLIFFGGFMVLLASGMPVAFSFLMLNVIFMFLYWGGSAGLTQLINSLFSSVASFTLLPIPLYIIMGEVLFRAGLATKMIDVLDKWLGRLPGRLGLLAVASGTIFATLSGASVASTAVLGSVLVPEMQKRGYSKAMSLGPILGSGGLAIMIPPSNLAVLLGAVGEISVGKILVAIIMPGLLMAAMMAAYIIIRCWLQPSLAPPYDVPPEPLSVKLWDTLRYVVPLGVVVFLVIGLVFVGVATPSEAAATGALGAFLLAAAYKKLSWEAVKKSVSNTIRTTVMMFMIIAGATAFSQIIAFSGASRGLSEFALNAPVAPILVITAMMAVSIFLGCFINIIAIIMLTVPIFAPVVKTLGFDLVWWAAVYLLTLEMGAITPPFGLSMFVLKGVAKGATIGDIYRASLPYCYIQTLEVAMLLAFPAISLWLPGLMWTT